MVDATTGYEVLSFMDGFSGYNQIRMNPKDEELTSFHTPKVLTAPVPGKSLTLYVAAQKYSLGALLAQVNEEGKENALCYLSWTLVGTEMKYSPIEKMCLALIFAAKKLRHYMLSNTINLVLKIDPLKYIMSRPILSGRNGKWVLQLSEFDIKFIPQKAIKGQVLADFLADHPIPAEWELQEDLPDEEVLFAKIIPSWRLYFDGAARSYGAGAGVVFITPYDLVMPYSFTLTEKCSNNVAEYQALIIGLETALDLDIHQLEVFGDSKLIINQLLVEYEVRNLDLKPYHEHAAMLMRRFDLIKSNFVSRSENKKADALANLAAVLARSDEEFSYSISIAQRWVLPSLLPSNLEENNSVEVVEDEEREDWRQPIIDFLQHQKLPDNPRRKTEIKRHASRFIFYKGTLYRRSFDGVFLRCLSNDEATQVVEESHSRICGAH
ncbi:uncharacterized protein LOC111368297 [Olea europaea var. sylvestris]|uniref:uncharacterized protein LOC111368297 n=1 Tax=Olea europaea var. sylvestris TaxID=158386 RepID=UPI000C1D0F04|nr:uncharacterized protein LOC111368297 [Olea europaea var. sylvestris]